MRDRTNSSTSSDGRSSGLEEQVVRFAERLGWLVGTVQGKAEGWMEGRQLRQQLTDIRDGAAELLTQISGDSARPASRRSAAVNEGKDPGRRRKKKKATSTARRPRRS